MRKQHRKSFLKRKCWRASASLELIHTNICLPMKTASLGSQRYFIIFIDDYLRMAWVYFLKEKLKIFATFKRFKAFVEKQKGCNIKTICSDRRGEYISREFEEHCRIKGIGKQLKARYNPEQNGIFERKNITIIEMARIMMNEKGLPKGFWTETIYTTVYILNRCPTKALKDKIPVEAWSRIKPFVSHSKNLGVFIMLIYH